MFHLQTLRLHYFKNYTEVQFTLCPEVNCFVGNNGAGKTNILDAIYYFAFTKSYFGNNDAQQIKQGESDYFFIEAQVEKGSVTENVSLAYKLGAKKTVKVNHNEHQKLGDHIGFYPLVMIAPNDILLILEGSEERRKFIDGFIAQCDKAYLFNLLAYNRILEQRNKLLKKFAELGNTDHTLLQTYNEQLVQYGTSIYQTRKQFTSQFVPVFQEYYQLISGGSESVFIDYLSDLTTLPYAELLAQQQATDLAAMRTTKGPHKDDWVFYIKGQLLKKMGSQGQQKSFIIALKLAQYRYLKQQTGLAPLLLLDDVFEKLDEQRLQTLLSMIAHHDFGQIFITDTHIQRLQAVFKTMPQVAVKFFNVQHGTISDI